MGSIVVDTGNNMASFRIRRISQVISVILPIFDQYPLLTSKFYNYDLFKRAALIMNDNTLSMVEKDTLLIALKTLSNCTPVDYVSPA